MWWQVGAAANLVVAIAYLMISWAIIAPLVRTGQVRANRLGVATSAIFLTCAVHHGSHFVHMVLPSFGLDEAAGASWRDAWDWHMSVWDVVTAAVGVYYWSLRSTYGDLMKGASLFEDLKEKQRQALEINDNIVQGLVTAKMALELDQQERSEEALSHALASARHIISELLGEEGTEGRLEAGDLVRSRPASPDVDRP
jgi:signal transduction histidine kinase